MPNNGKHIDPIKPGDLVQVPGESQKYDMTTGIVRAVLFPYCRVNVAVSKTKTRLVFYRLNEVKKL